MKKIIFEELNFFNILLIFFFRLLCLKIFFLKITPLLRKKSLIFILEKIGISKIDFNNPNHSISDKYNQMKEESLVVASRIANKIIKDIWSQEIKKKFIEKEFLKIFLINYFKIRVYENLMLFEFAHKLNTDNQKSYFWINKDIITNETSKNYLNCIILKPSFLNFFTDTLNLISQLSFGILNRLKITKFEKKLTSSKKINLKKFKTLYFVSGGIVGANSNYVSFKNFFFSNKKTSPLNKNNILICEISKTLNPSSLSYFKKLKINFFYWYKKQAIKLIKNNFFLFMKIIFRPILIYNLTSSIRICWAILDINRNLKSLEDFPNMKNAIIDDEFQFPTTLAIALKHKEIKINCVAKRLIYPAIKHQFIIDNYFVLGKQTLIDLRHQLYKNINPIIIGGFESMPYKKNSKYLKKLKKKFNYVCLVLDYHSDKSWYVSSTNPLSNWSENLKFYELILKISKNYPKMLFVLKGKNYNWTEIPFFKEIYTKIKKQKNLILFSKKVQITNYEMSHNTDFSIARWTSLVDDIMMNNKPVIIFDTPSYVTGTINYPAKILSYNFNDLNKKIEEYQDNPIKFNCLLDDFRKKHYTKFDLKKCQNHLIKILK